MHNDVNDYNLLVESMHAGQRVTGLIDFGDVMRSATVAELVEVYRRRHLPNRKPATRIEYERLLERAERSQQVRVGLVGIGPALEGRISRGPADCPALVAPIQLIRA